MADRKTRSSFAMFDGGLSAYKTVHSEEYLAVLKNGLVVLDTNSLLDLYRYHEKTRQDFLRLYASLSATLWIPHHVMYEFLERRVEVIDEHAAYPESTIAELRISANKYRERLATWANRIGLSQDKKDEISGILDNACNQIDERIREFSRDDTLLDAEDTSNDPVLSSLQPLVNDHVGAPLPDEEFQTVKAEARRRLKLNIPPGFEDAGKKGDSATGDYIIWYETLKEAAKRNVDVLFVTRDQKKDWWRVEKGQAKGPRWELVAELESHAGTRLYMLRPPSLAEHAPGVVSTESVQDAKRVSSKSSIGWHPRPGWGTVRDYTEVINDDGTTDFSFTFYYDDQSVTPMEFAWKDTRDFPQFAEYARGIFDGTSILIRVSAKAMAEAQVLFERINKLDVEGRQEVFGEGTNLNEDCGWAWTEDYKLVKAAPGLL